MCEDSDSIQVGPRDDASLLHILRAEKSGVLVIGEGELFGTSQESFLQAGLPLLLVDGEL
jgi:hypothetical protein